MAQIKLGQFLHKETTAPVTADNPLHVGNIASVTIAGTEYETAYEINPEDGKAYLAIVDAAPHTGTSFDMLYEKSYAGLTSLDTRFIGTSDAGSPSSAGVVTSLNVKDKLMIIKNTHDKAVKVTCRAYADEDANVLIGVSEEHLVPANDTLTLSVEDGLYPTKHAISPSLAIPFPFWVARLQNETVGDRPTEGEVTVYVLGVS